MHDNVIGHLEGEVDCLAKLTDSSRLEIHATITCIG
jgi:hypothetical protein